jgi:hypothetical protein
MESYKILKVPITKDKSVFYYYKRYAGGSADKEKEGEMIVELPAERTIQICHFVRAIDENTL